MSQKKTVWSTDQEPPWLAAPFSSVITPPAAPSPPLACAIPVPFLVPAPRKS